MPYRRLGDDPARWRCLDAQAWGLAALACTLYLPQVGRTILGDLSLLYVAPVVWTMLAVLAIGEPAGMAGPWQVWRLRCAWLSVAGLSPFVAWWMRCLDVPYLAVASAASMAAASWAALETSWFVSQLGRSRGVQAMVLDALVVRIGILYLLVIPLAALWLTLIVALLLGWAASPGDWLRFWRQIPAWGRLPLLYGPLLALLNLARLLLRASVRLCSLPTPPAVPQGDALDDLDPRPQDPPDRPA